MTFKQVDTFYTKLNWVAFYFADVTFLYFIFVIISYHMYKFDNVHVIFFFFF